MEEMRENAVRPGKRVGKYILLVLLLALLGAAAAISIYCYSRWRTAVRLERLIDFSAFSYDMEVELCPEELDPEQRQLLEMLAETASLEQNAVYHLRLTGRVYQNIIYAEVFPEGMTQPVLKLYLSGDRDVADCGYLYQCIREDIAGGSRLLGAMLPPAEDEICLTLEQAEQLLSMDLSGIRNFQPPFDRLFLSAKEYFAVLIALPLVKQGEGSSLIFEEQDGGSLYFAVQEPALLAEQNQSLLEKIGITSDSGELEKIPYLAVQITSRQVEPVIIPQEGVSQELINVLSEVRRLLER